MTAEGIYPHPNNLAFYLNRLFAGIEIDNKTALEIGGGSGFISYFLAMRGATQVVCLEPEAAGSDPHAREQFRSLGDRLGVEHVSLVGETIQDFEWTGALFDLVVMNSSINHIDEAATRTLARNADARSSYEGVFRKIATLTRPSGNLIVTDCTRHNAWGLMHLRNPLAPEIEWQKHQPPRTWAKLLSRCGFADPEITWLSPNTLRTPGRLAMGNRAAAFLLDGRFCLRMRRV